MGKGSKLVKGGSWMSKHVTNLLQDMPIDNRASGKGPGEYGKPKGPGKHHEGPMKHGMMHDGPGDYGKMKGPGDYGKMKGPGEYGKMKGPGEYGKMKGPGKHGMHKGPMKPGDTKKKTTELENVNVTAPKNITITEGFYTNPSGRPSKFTKEGHKITTKVDKNKYTLIDGKRVKGKIISQSYLNYDRSS
jgi:hypothetical protein